MKILIIGGTVFLGRALVNAALENGHEITLFNRGKSNPNLFPQVEQVIGDRKSDLSALSGRQWDAVIDTCGYFPKDVRRTSNLLKESVGNYTFISSLSVYADTSQKGLDETAPVAQLADDTVEEINGETYGPLKALCEQAVRDVLPDRALVIRPGLIVGPHDPSDRFTYWPVRIARGGRVLAPGRPERGVQFIDVRDLAEWIIHLLENQKTGVYNANGPQEPVSMGKLLETCKGVSGSDADIVWVEESFLSENDVSPWIELPLWIPESDPESAGFFAFDIQKAVSNGLKFRTIHETIRATLEWEKTRPEHHNWRAGLPVEKEIGLLRRWEERTLG